MHPARIDLRSDTVTLPTEAMLEAMRRARLGDDGLDRDPTVRDLENLAAALTGKDDALFVASGTMGNLVACLTHTTRGGRILVDEHAHIACSEAAGITALAGLAYPGLPARDGELDLDALAAALRPRSGQAGSAEALIVAETTHAQAGGRPLPPDYLRLLHARAHATGVPVHIDGARAFNAAVALGVDIAAIARHGDSLSFCLSKGLSAPVGAVLAGSHAFVARARIFRRMVGGGMRQAGCIAAAGIVALQDMVGRLAEDHRRAALLWQALHVARPALVAPAPPATNILRLTIPPVSRHLDEQQWADQFRRQGLLLRPAGPDTLRLVTHRHISDDDVRTAAGLLAENLGEPLRED